MSEGKRADKNGAGFESKFDQKYDDGSADAAAAAAAAGTGDGEGMTDSDLEAEAEWEALKNAKQEGEAAVSEDPRAQKILAGFKINFMKMRDAHTGELMWHEPNWKGEMFYHEKEARVPADILKCKAVAREINFSSTEMMENFHITQKIFFEGTCMEEWRFHFGFVIPESTNNWDQQIEAAAEEDMLPASLLSGKVTIETSFFDDQLLVAKSKIRVWYV